MATYIIKSPQIIAHQIIDVKFDFEKALDENRESNGTARIMIGPKVGINITLKEVSRSPVNGDYVILDPKGVVIMAKNDFEKLFV